MKKYWIYYTDNVCGYDSVIALQDAVYCIPDVKTQIKKIKNNWKDNLKNIWVEADDDGHKDIIYLLVKDPLLDDFYEVNNLDKKEEKYVEEITRDFDIYGNEIHEKHSSGFESWSEYDGRGNCIHYKIKDGLEYWSTYDENNKRISYRSNGKDND